MTDIKEEYDTKKVVTIIAKVYNEFIKTFSAYEIRYLKSTRNNDLYYQFKEALQNINVTRDQLYRIFLFMKLPIGTLYDTCAPKQTTDKQITIMKEKIKCLLRMWCNDVKKYQTHIDELQNIMMVDRAPIFMFNTCMHSAPVCGRISNKDLLYYDCAEAFIKHLKYLCDDDFEKLGQFIDSYYKNNMDDRQRKIIDEHIELYCD